MPCCGRLPGSIDITLIVNGSIMTIFTQKVPVPKNEKLNFELDLPVSNSCSIRLSVTARNQFEIPSPLMSYLVRHACTTYYQKTYYPHPFLPII